MTQPYTVRLYEDEDFCFTTEALVTAIRENSIAFDRTCFFPGGGGQPNDTGWVDFPGEESYEIVSAHIDPDDLVWHTCKDPLPGGIVGRSAVLRVNQERRLALTRYHTVLHILNTIALRDYGGWITGVQISVDYSRIDFKLEAFSREMCAAIENKVNAVIDESHSLRSYYLSEQEFSNRPDLLRTLEVKPPVHRGRVRIVEIEGFDAQACGGTHMSRTSDVGRFSIFKIENKGKINKRLYVRLEETAR